MARPSFSMFSILILALLVQVALGENEIKCEELNKDTCAFAVSSSSNRCVLEKQLRRTGYESYVCATSDVEASDSIKNLIETDRCVESCGLDRNTFGISSDALLERGFAQRLCSNDCYENCPNVVDLYFNLAAGEGVYLPKLCEAQRSSSRREMAEIKSSGDVAALGPESSFNSLDAVAAPSPLSFPITF